MKAPGGIFISYRRDGGAEMARLIRDALQHRGFRVFMDVEDLRSGRFDVALLSAIDGCTDVIVILSPNSLERCAAEGDWVRREVAHAIAHGKNVVTVRTRGFHWPEQPLPNDIADLRYFQGIEPSHNLFSASVDKLVLLLKSRPSLRASRRFRAALALTCGVALVALAATYFRRPQSARETNLPPAAPAPRDSQTAPATTRPAPASQPANLAFARDLCFNHDQWTSGAALLAQCPGVLQPPALAEVRGPGMAGESNLARLWAQAGTAAPVPDNWHCFRRARYWYQKALANSFINTDAAATQALRDELARLPAPKATLRLSGTSSFRERFTVKRDAMTWTSEENGGGPFRIQGVKPLPPFGTAWGESRQFPEADARALLPDGVDFLTAKLAGSRFGGTTGSVSEILSFRILPSGDGVEVKFGEKNAANVRYPGSFTFNILITFGQ